MRTSNILLLAGIFLLMSVHLTADFKTLPDAVTSPINAIIGDESYVKAYGKVPGSSVTDADRIHIHLSYVEELLRESTPTGLTAEQIGQRMVLLDHLRDYRLAGGFPVNDNHPDQRRPTFISENGNICAVGYLVEQSAGRAVAELINEHHKYSYITSIDLPEFLEWAGGSGFTIEELAMIQPAYQSVSDVQQTTNRLEPSYVLTTGLLVTANALYWSSGTAANSAFSDNSFMQWTGLAIGTGTMLHGMLNSDLTTRRQVTVQNGMWSSTTNYVERNYLRAGLSAGQVLVGAATVFYSARSLINGQNNTGANESGLIVTSFSLPHESGYQAVGGVGYRFAIN